MNIPFSLLFPGYGLTESSSTGTVTDADDISLGRVGTPLLDVDFKLVSWKDGGYSVTDSAGPRGEIHIGGKVFKKCYAGGPLTLIFWAIRYIEMAL